jgi:hypothetical protein
MTTIEDSSLTTKNPSNELLNLMEDLKYNLIKTKDLFVTIVNKARDEGFNDKEIDTLLHSKLKEIIPRKTLYRYRQEFIPLAINERNNSVKQPSIISGSNDTTDTKIPTLPNEMNTDYQNDNVIDITTNERESYENIPNMSNDTFNNEFQENDKNDVNITTSHHETQYTKPKETKSTPKVVGSRSIQEEYIPQIVSDSLEVVLTK